MLRLDHVVAPAGDIDVACRAFERLGFTVSPRSVHPEGTMRNAIVFESTFYELLSFHDAERFRRAIASGMMPVALLNLVLRTLETREGPSLTAVASDDAEADVAKLAERGIEIAEPLRCTQPVLISGGQETEAVVTDWLLPNPIEPDASLYISEQHNQELVWGVPEWQHHRNGAIDIDSVMYVAETPLAHVPYFTAIFGDSVQQTLDEEFHFAGGPNRIIVTTPARFRSRFAGLDLDLPSGVGLNAVTIRVRGIDVVAACLEESGVVSRSSPAGSIQVSPESAAGGLIEFVERESHVLLTRRANSRRMW